MKKIIVIGLDGATWDLLNQKKFLEKLTTFKYLIDNGCHGILESTIPHFTPPAWSSITTGKNPENIIYLIFFI